MTLVELDEVEAFLLKQVDFRVIGAISYEVEQWIKTCFGELRMREKPQIIKYLKE